MFRMIGQDEMSEQVGALSLNGNGAVKPKPKFAVVFDIDGVLVHGSTPIPGAKEAVERVLEMGVPHVFLTNNGKQTEYDKAAGLQDIIGAPVTGDRVILCQTPLQDDAARFGEQLVLVAGETRHPDGGAAGLLRGLGFKNVMDIEDYAACFPELMPAKRFRRGLDYSPPPAPQEPVAAIVIIETPQDWHESLQVMVDLLGSEGHPHRPLPPDSPQAVEFIVCNFDLTYAWEGAGPRMGPGAFTRCLQVMLSEVAGRELVISKSLGKPNPPAYHFAQKKLLEQLPEEHKDAFDRMSIYAIGDNPASDVRGANQAGNNWRSVLVRTGVFQGTSNDPTDEADMVVKDIGAAMHSITTIESFKF